MNQNNLENILKNKAFAEKIIKLQTPEEVQSAFKEKEIEISIEEVKLLGSIINKMVEKQSTNFSENDLKEIAGGTYFSDFKKGFNMSKKFYGDAFFNNSNAERLCQMGQIFGNFIITAGIFGTAIGLYHAVPWAYKKAKSALNLNPSEK